MDSILTELLIILFLIAVNGFFSMSEFAIISCRKSLIAQLVSDGSERAAIIEKYQQDPHQLLAVVQIGVTVAGSAASTVGGIVAIRQLRPLIAQAPWSFVSSAAEPLSAFLVIIIISFVTLIIGELVPKAIGLQFSGKIALNTAKPIRFIAAILAPLITILTFSSKSILALMRIKDQINAFITREEVQHMILEGHESGVFSETEHEYIRNVFEFTHTCVREVMVPRTRMVGLEVSIKREELLKVIQENQYSRYPVYRDSIEEIIGVVHDKDLIGPLVHNEEINLETLLRPPVFVPEAKRINDLLKEMQLSRNHMALVVDEYGGISGLVTTEDLLEELVGEIEDEHDTGESVKIMKQPDGSWLVDGLVPVFDLQEPLNIKLEDDPNYDTLAGLILNELGRLPKQGETLHWMGYRLVCKQVTRTAVLQVRIIPDAV